MKIFNGVADLKQAVGTHIGYSQWTRITQEQIDMFADATGDHQWIHVDTERAAKGPFGTTIAHGYLTLSLLPVLVRQVYRVEGIRMGINYGTNKVRFPEPVPVGSLIRAGVELLGVVEAANGHQISVRVTVEREDGVKPACVVESLSILAP